MDKEGPVYHVYVNNALENTELNMSPSSKHDATNRVKESQDADVRIYTIGIDQKMLDHAYINNGLESTEIKEAPSLKDKARNEVQMDQVAIDGTPSNGGNVETEHPLDRVHVNTSLESTDLDIPSSCKSDALNGAQEDLDRNVGIHNNEDTSTSTTVTIKDEIIFNILSQNDYGQHNSWSNGQIIRNSEVITETKAKFTKQHSTVSNGTGQRKRPTLARVASDVSGTLQSRGRAVSRRIQLWQKSCLLFFALLLYLVLGAFIFRAVERPHHIDSQKQLINLTQRFLRENECVTKEELDVYTTQLLKVLNENGINPFKATTSTNNTLSELWTLPNAFFFACAVVTTIGYGNITPTTDLGKHLCIAYALIGIPMTGWMLSSIGKSFQNSYHKFKKFVKRLTKEISPSKSTQGVINWSVTFIIMYSSLIAIPAVAIAFGEGWTYIDAQYFCFISLSTIGFGDLTPSINDEVHIGLQWLKTLLYVCYLMLGLSVISVALTAFLRKHEEKFKKAGARVKKFVQDSARSATVRMKEVEISLRSQGSLSSSPSRKKGNVSRDGSCSSKVSEDGGSKTRNGHVVTKL